MSTRFLGTWVGIFGTLLILTAVGMLIWREVNPDPNRELTSTAFSFMMGGGTLTSLGMACHRIARLEDRVKELERARDPVAVQASVGSNG